MKSLLPHPRSALLPALLLLALIIATAGSFTLPMDGHEAFVVQTTQEMQSRSDWIVPWYNGEPRLNKPPLNYWLTGIIAWATGSLDQISPWHGRFVSALGALLMALATFFAADMLYGRLVALLSAFFLITSLGFFNYSHDARPDMLYAALCSAGYIAFIAAWKAPVAGKQICFALLMWMAYALATISKGPHMPAIYLVASLLFCRWQKMSVREAWRLIRPVTGLLLYAAIALPWWLLIQDKLGGEGLQGTQLSGSLLTALRLDHLHHLYYFYRPLLLVLPWLIFLPHTIMYFRHAHNDKDNVKLLGLYLLVPALALSFGSQERWFYMLPSLPPMVILLATGAEYMLSRRANPQLAYRVLMCLCLAAGLSYTLAGYQHFGWSKERFEFQALAQQAQNLQQPGMPVYTLRLHPDVFVYYLKPRIMQMDSMDAILANLYEHGRHRALVILPSKAVSEIPAQARHQVVYSTSGTRGKALSLALLSPAQ